jgi:hypothetical protein
LKQIFERLLGVFGHIVDLIKYNKFKADLEQILRFNELINLVANDVDPSLVGRVQMNYQTLVFFYFLVLVNQIDDGGGFASSWRSIQQNIGEIFMFEHIKK